MGTWGDYRNSSLSNPYLTDTLQRLWKAACKDVGVEIEPYQATRHSVASMAASSGVSLAIIKEVLGTYRYKDYSEVFSYQCAFAIAGLCCTNCELREKIGCV